MNVIDPFMGVKKLIVLITCVCSLVAKAQDSLDIKIGQMILVGMPATEVDQKVLNEVREGKVGSIILFEKNIPKLHSFHELKKIIWAYKKVAPIPLMVAIDQEGGLVNRLKEKYGFPRSITAQVMGQDPSMDSLRFYAETTAGTLASLGINVNFGPVVDLHSNPDNPIIAKVERAFSEDPKKVAAYAKAWIEIHRRMGIVTSPKHFPGHGSSKSDTHHGLVDVTDTWNEKELIPYAQLAKSGLLDAVMTSHIVHRGLDKEGNPGTLSKPIVTGLLREKIHFNGVVFTDDMQMHAITKYYGFEEAIFKAIDAGVDIMIFSNNIASSDERTAEAVHRIIKGFVSQGRITEDRIDQSFRRIMKLKYQQEKTSSTINQEIQRSEQQVEKMMGTMNDMQKTIDDLKIQNAALKNLVEETQSTSKKRKKNKRKYHD